MCDSCGSVWCGPDDVREDGPFEEPSAPEWSACGDRLTPGADQWASVEDVKRVGWDRLEWHDDVIDRVEGTESSSLTRKSNRDGADAEETGQHL